MAALLPVTGHVVAPAHAADVVAPPYDLLTEAELAELSRCSPDSFLRVLPSGSADAGGLADNVRALRGLLASDRFDALDRPSLGVLCLDHPAGRTVALLGDVEVAAFFDGRVLPHERIDADRVGRLVRHLEVVGIASSPVCVVHRPDPAVTAATRVATAAPPLLTFLAADGVRVSLHLVDEPPALAALAGAVEAAGTLFVADGHHRAAAVAAHARHGGAPRVLTAVVPSDQLQVLAFHRRIDGLRDVTASRVLATLEADDLWPEPVHEPSEPAEPGTALLTVAGRWWAVDLRDRRGSGPVEGLDVRAAERHLLEPLAGLGAGPEGITIVPVPAPQGLDALVRPGSVGVALHPPTIDEVLAVAEAGEVMPPKSTYLAPKLRSGLLVVPR